MLAEYMKLICQCAHISYLHHLLGFKQYFEEQDNLLFINISIFDISDITCYIDKQDRRYSDPKARNGQKIIGHTILKIHQKIRQLEFVITLLLFLCLLDNYLNIKNGITLLCHYASF